MQRARARTPRQILNILITFLLGFTTWEMMHFQVIMAHAEAHPHLSGMFVIVACGMQSMAYAFILLTVITSIAKQVAASVMNPSEFGALPTPPVTVTVNAPSATAAQSGRGMF